MVLSRNVRLEFTKEDKTTVSNKEKVENLGKAKNEIIHTVVYGDNLWNLAKTYLGSGKKFKLIYDANKAAIEEMVKRKGKSEHYKGYWIMPGMKLIIPIESKSENKVLKNNKNRTDKEFSDYVTDFTYIDVADGKSDSISLTLYNIFHFETYFKH